MTSSTSGKFRRFSGVMMVFGLAIGAVASTGCDSSKLETGYRYRRLGDSDAQRRAYYAPEYSRESMTTEPRDTGAADLSRRRPNSSQY